MAAVVGGLAGYSRLTSSSDDDWADRLNHIYSVIMLVILALFVTSGQYIGQPIQCWLPAQYSTSDNGWYLAYANSVCWIKNTYYISMDDAIPVEYSDREAQELTYYQWVPITLLFMAFLFKLPNMIWRAWNGGSGLSMEKIINMTVETQIGDPRKRLETVKHLAIYLDGWLDAKRNYERNFIARMRQLVSRIVCNKSEGTYLTNLYMFIKLGFLVNVICQFFLLNSFLGDWFSVYGFEVMEFFATHGELKESPRFPRVTLCDFKIRQMQNVQRFSVQCVLPINHFNEKIFAFLWFWLAILTLVTSYSFLCWIYRILFVSRREVFVKKYLELAGEINSDGDRDLVKKFGMQYLRDDGIFLFRIIEHNSNSVLLTDIVVQMWTIFKNKPRLRRMESPVD